VLQWLRRIAPEPLIGFARGVRQRYIYGSSSYPEIFAKVYRENRWLDSESRSGRGSTIAFTASIRAELSRFLHETGARSMVDLPCGDFNWMHLVRFPDGMDYLGIDIVPELVEQNRERHDAGHVRFELGDVLADQLPKADVYFCRDLLIHFPNHATEQAIANIRRSGARYLIATTYPAVRVNRDTRFPDSRRQNLALHLGEPERLLEDGEPGKYMGVWRLN
jgi:SAM-dependent methyltransferase